MFVVFCMYVHLVRGACWMSSGFQLAAWRAATPLAIVGHPQGVRRSPLEIIIKHCIFIYGVIRFARIKHFSKFNHFKIELERSKLHTIILLARRNFLSKGFLNFNLLCWEMRFIFLKNFFFKKFWYVQKCHHRAQTVIGVFTKICLTVF